MSTINVPPVNTKKVGELSTVISINIEPPNLSFFDLGDRVVN